MIATDQTIGQPKIAENTTPGAEMIVPQASPREQRKRNDVSVRVAGPNRFSRNSYAVYTLARCRYGTIVTPRITIATGSPK